MTVTPIRRKPKTELLRRYFPARERLPLAAMVARAIGKDWDEGTHRPYLDSVIDWAVEARINAMRLRWALQGHLDVRRAPDGTLLFVSREKRRCLETPSAPGRAGGGAPGGPRRPVQKEAAGR